MKHSAKQIALGGIFAALAVIIMNMGGLIPVATYVSPMLCMLLLTFILQFCGSRVAWAWYGAVAILSLLMSPDKEAAAVFAFLGYYPILKPRMDKLPARWFWKGLLFNCAILAMYWLLMNLFGVTEITAEFAELGNVMLVIMLLMGNLIFFLLDRILSRFRIRKRGA